MIIGYARVSTQEQHLDAQLDALNNANCEQIFEEKITGKHKDRPELKTCLKTEALAKLHKQPELTFFEKSCRC